MAEIINLRRARKQKQRIEDAATAEANRLKFGRSKSEKKLQVLEEQRTAQLLDGHKREPE